LALDRIYAGGPAMLHGVSVYRSPLARLASDHLPLMGTLFWDGRGVWRRDRRRLPRRRRRLAAGSAAPGP